MKEALHQPQNRGEIGERLQLQLHVLGGRDQGSDLCIPLGQDIPLICYWFFPDYQWLVGMPKS